MSNEPESKEFLFPRRIHLIGVAGSGMSGLAQLFLDAGHVVSGCDRVSSQEVERLQRAGLDFSCPQSAESIEGAELVVYSSAIKPGNLPFDAASKRGVPMMRRAEALAALLNQKRGIVVAGTHGKTTTSALLTHALRSTGVIPSHYVGAEIPVLGTNAHWTTEGGSDGLMVAEGDESDGTLVHYRPAFAIVLNVEAEHLDHYTDGIEGIDRVFSQLLDQTREGIVYCAEDAGACRVGRNRELATSYGWRRDFDFAAEITASRAESTDFLLFQNGEEAGMWRLGIPGRHNVLNALAVIATLDRLGVDLDSVKESLASFRGARRRFEMRYRSANFTIIDDYGHHPTEIAATVATAAGLQPERFLCVFQPHRFTRTKLLRDQFGPAFRGVDELFVTDIYPASEPSIPGVTGQMIVDAAREAGLGNGHFTPTFHESQMVIGNRLRPGDLLLTLGAGNVHEIGTKLAEDLAILEELRDLIHDPETTLKLYEPMRRHTTMKVGGPAQFWIEPSTVEAFSLALKFCRNNSIPVRLVGRGSNLIVRDGGIRGAVIHPSGGEFDEVRVLGRRLIAGVGARFKKVSNVARAAGLGGFEWMEGIPGAVGGGLRMNAGAMGTETFDQVVCVTFLDQDGEIFEKSADEIAHEYRNVPEMEEVYAVQAEFIGDPSVAQEKIDELIATSMEKRRSTQPIAATSGCTFKNPVEIPAGKLIDELGLKGMTVGGARVSDIHANFIVNNGDATATDVLALIDQIKAIALERRGIRLETEVQIIGESKGITD